MQIFIGNVDYTAFIRQETIDISVALSDPVPTAEFVLEDPGATFPLDCLMDAVIIDDANNYPNPTHNIMQDPMFLQGGALWNPHIPVGSIVYNSGAGNATLAVNTAANFDNVSLTQTTRPFAVLPSSAYTLSFLYNISALSNASVTFTKTIINGDGTTTSSTDTFSANTSGNTAYTSTITTGANTIAIQVQFAINNLAGTSVGTLVIIQPQLEFIDPFAGFSYPTPSCVPGAANCIALPDYTVVRQNRIFGGLTMILDVTYDGPNRLYDIKCAGYAILLSKLYVTSDYINANDNDIIQDLVEAYAPGLLSADHVITLPSATYDQVSWQNITLKDAFGAIAGATGTIYFVDAYGAVHYQFPGYSQSGIELSDNPDYNLTYPFYEYKLTRDATEMANRIRVDGGTGGSSNQQVQPAQTEDFNGDGSTTTFTLEFLPRAVQSITVGGVRQRIGIAKKDSFSRYDVLVNKPSQQITFNVAPPSGTNNVEATYTYLSPPSVRVRDGSSIAKYGFILDAKLDDSILVTSGDTYQRGLTELSKYSTPLKSIDLKTNYGPWSPGDTVGITSTPDGFAGTPFLIQSVKAAMLGVDQTDTLIPEYELQIGAYRPDILHHIKHIQSKVKGQSSNTSVAPLEYIVAFDQINYAETVRGSLYSGTIPGGGTPPVTNYIDDNFTPREQSGGWGTASDGVHVWSINTLANVNLSVDDAFGIATWSGGGGSNSNASVEMLCGSTQPADIEVLTQWRALDNFNNGREVGTWTRLIPGVSSYFADIHLGYGGSTLAVKKQISGFYSAISPSFNLDVDPDDFFWMRFRTSGTFIAVKFWVEPDDEPTTWLWSGTDSSVAGSGRVGVRIGQPGRDGPVWIGEYHVSAA